MMWILLRACVISLVLLCCDSHLHMEWCDNGTAAHQSGFWCPPGDNNSLLFCCQGGPKTQRFCCNEKFLAIGAMPFWLEFGFTFVATAFGVATVVTCNFRLLRMICKKRWQKSGDTIPLALFIHGSAKTGLVGTGSFKTEWDNRSAFQRHSRGTHGRGKTGNSAADAPLMPQEGGGTQENGTARGQMV